ncbi:sodium:solute symporter family protein [Aneurinibacillus tyrosinisolvens]|uniref:sodium:solute symporter family protein n=1 Tax=Aneurinibacillus tyrosinisolvens TaxID=1443435 RepID=UPI00063F9E79|nr:sodium:solute symporter [Aneurinibacillus tyrosinisolvens]
MNAALIVIFGFLLLSLYLGIRAKKGKDMNLEQWTVGGRGFGALFVFLLMAGEIYTTFTFLGGSAWAYGKGGPALYILAYISLSYILGYFFLPLIWKYAKENNLMSQPDFFATKYKSPFLGIVVSFVGVIAMIPYLILQFKGLGIIVSEASYGSISPSFAIWIGAISLTIYVMVSGIHGSAWTAVIKDIMIFAIVIFLGIYMPFHYYGGLQPMFEAVHTANPTFLALPEKGLGISWFISTVVLTVLGFYMWPHTFGAVYSAQNEKVFRKNAIVSPLYTLMLLFVFFVGFTAILQVPGLKGSEQDLSLLRLSVKTFDPWLVGFVGAAGLLTALVPGSMLLMASGTSLAKNIYKVVVPSATDLQVSKLAKYLVPVVSLISVYFTLNGGNTIVTLLLMGYSLVTQLFPCFLFSLMKNNFVTKYGACAGIIVGICIVTYITVTKTTVGTLLPSLPQGVKDLNVGVIALIMNITVLVIVSLATRNFAASKKVEPMENIQTTMIK